MSRVFPLLVLAAGMTMLSSCAPVSGPAPAQTTTADARQCFHADRVDNFRGNNQTLYVRTNNRDVFELRSLGYCPEIDFAFGIAFIPNGGLTRLCTDDTARILVSGGQAPRNQCRVQVVKKLTEADIAALKPRDRP